MGVPAHDERDFAFAKALDLDVVQVISTPDNRESLDQAYIGSGTLINSGPFDGMDNHEVQKKINYWLEERGLGHEKIQFRLRDWCISRQRYWGPPIPIIHCPDCGTVPVPEADLPIRLPEIANFAPDGSGRSPLALCEDFVNTHCPQCGKAAHRETDVSDNFLDSTWYFFRYPSSNSTKHAFDPERTRRWLPVDMYIGGNEHAVLHLMYTRFMTMALHDMGLIDFSEPFKCFRANGMILKNGVKMSKSKGNTINPNDYIDRYGTDVMRTYLMFAGNFQDGCEFRDQGIHGIQRFLDRLWRYVIETQWDEGQIVEDALLHLLHQKIHKVTEDLERLHYNTAIPVLMELLDGLRSNPPHYRQAVKVLLQLVAPFAPCITQELWESMGETGQIVDAAWPMADPVYVHQELIEWIVQINGKVRARLNLAADSSQKGVEKKALESQRVQALLKGKDIVKTVFVPQRLVNFVLKN